MFDTADYSYILPTHRLTVYVMGIALGYGLHHWGRDFKLKTVSEYSELCYFKLINTLSVLYF